MVVSEVVKGAIWLKGLLDELGLKHGLTVIYCDNQNIKNLTKT